MKITLIRSRTEWIVVRHSPSCPPSRSRPLSRHPHSVFITSGDGEFSPYHLSWCVFLRILFSEVCSFFWSWEQYFPSSFTMTWMTGPLIPSYCLLENSWLIISLLEQFKYIALSSSGTEYFSPQSLNSDFCSVICHLLFCSRCPKDFCFSLKPCKFIRISSAFSHYKWMHLILFKRQFKSCS